MERRRSESGIRIKAIGVALATAASGSACSSSGQDAPAVVIEDPGTELDGGDDADAASVTCVDGDGDGYGTGCPAGPDCDDGDPTVHTGCGKCTKVGTQGCPCDPGLAPDAGGEISCGKVYQQVGDIVVCGDGIAECLNGAWGPCRLKP